MTRYVVAVSGGIDSVVLLDLLVHSRPITGQAIWSEKPQGEIIVAHFDHGIRDNSMDDAEFVEKLAHDYGVKFEMAREELGKHASEETARNRRYAFLRAVCKKYDAQLVTAHHSDDVVETIAINLTRGTGWRGLAVLDAPDIWRPLLEVPKQTIRQYASEHDLSWREDSTNVDERYLRNRIRKQLVTCDTGTKEWVRELRIRQLDLKKQIDEEVSQLIGVPPYSRYAFTHYDEKTAIELLRAVFLRDIGTSPTIPQRRRALHAIKVAKPGAKYHVGEDSEFYFTRKDFIVVGRGKVVS
jgi:tRNA(Ile)-lysidine synthase